MPRLLRWTNSDGYVLEGYEGEDYGTIIRPDGQAFRGMYVKSVLSRGGWVESDGETAPEILPPPDTTDGT